MLYLSVTFDFWIMKKLWNLAHENLVNICKRWALCWDQYSLVSAIPCKLSFMYWHQMAADFSTLHTTVISFSDCHVTITQPFGVITSPGFPQLYQNGIDCTWNIQVPIGQLIQFNFLRFDVENVCRWVILLQTFCPT